VNYFEQSLSWFQVQTKNRQLSLIVGISLIAILTILLVVGVLTPGYGVLFNHLDSSDANQIITQLEQENIAYQLQNNGHDILIDKRLIDKTRIKLMSRDLALTHSVGFELFDKSDFGMTDFSQKINYQRALQGELERTISSLEEVKQARVHLVIPENHLFQQENNQPRVAVTLHLNQALSPQQVKSIQQLITASVANLPRKNVVIVDQNGNGLTVGNEDPATGHFAAKKSVEHYLNEKVMQMLNRIFTNDNVFVKIDATLNYDELQRELVKPQHNGLIAHEKETQHSSASKTDKKQENKDFTREKSYQFGREKERFTRANGTIERLTISVVLPHETDKGKIIQVERLVKSVVGFDAKRGDTISVEALIMSPEITTLPEVAILTPSPSSSKWLMYVSGGGLVLLFVIGAGVRVHGRTRQRQYLLNELQQWLTEHE
jgi:flagellar M-ring protein FliF